MVLAGGPMLEEARRACLRVRQGDLGVLVAYRVAELRQIRGLTVEEVAKRAGVHVSYVEKLEKEEAGIQPYVLRRLASALQVTVEELLCDTNFPERPLDS